MIDLKQQLLKVKSDPRYGRSEKDMAESLLERIEELENREIYHWTEMARFALLTEIKNQVVGKQAAAKITSFLNRHSIMKRY